MEKIINYQKNIRLNHYNYHSGWFFITNKTNLSKDLLTNNIETLVRKELFELVKKTDGVILDYFHMMPNHIHVIFNFNKSLLPLSEFWRRFKAITILKAKKIGLKESTLWQRNFYEHTFRNEKALEEIRKYVKNNPLKEELPLKEIYQEIKILQSRI